MNGVNNLSIIFGTTVWCCFCIKFSHVLTSEKTFEAEIIFEIRSPDILPK